MNINIGIIFILYFPICILPMDNIDPDAFEKNEYQLDALSFETILKEQPALNHTNKNKRILDQEAHEPPPQKKLCNLDSTESKHVSLILVECALCTHWFSSTQKSKVAINTLKSNFNHHLKEIHQSGHSTPEKFYSYQGPIPQKLSFQDRPHFFETIKEQFQEYQPSAIKSKKTKKNEKL